jgi:branched-chain amino acid transport system permease protein
VGHHSGQHCGDRGVWSAVALPALVTGPYLAMVALAFGTIIQILINEMTFLTEGPLGITIQPSVMGHKLEHRFTGSRSR